MPHDRASSVMGPCRMRQADPGPADRTASAGEQDDVVVAAVPGAAFEGGKAQGPLPLPVIVFDAREARKAWRRTEPLPSRS